MGGKRVSASLKKRWEGAIGSRLSGVYRSKGEVARAGQKGLSGMGAEEDFAAFERRLMEDEGALAAWDAVVGLARRHPELLTEAVSMDASAAELLLTEGDWGLGFELLEMAPEGLCEKPRRRLGMLSCAARGFSKGAGRNGEMNESWVGAFAGRVGERMERLGAARLMALAEEAELMLGDRQQWSEDERGRGRRFEGYAALGFSAGGWGPEAKGALAGLRALAESLALGGETRAAEWAEPSRPARL